MTKEKEVEVKEKKKESLVSKIIWTVVLVLAFIWAGLFFFEYLTVKKGNEPHICVVREERDHIDGSVSVCKGLGWVVYDYDREAIQGQEFGPFWIPERESLED